MRPTTIALLTAGLAAIMAGSASAASNLADYAGKYPSDEVNGTTFLGAPAVVAAVGKAVPDEVVRGWVLGQDTVQMPILVRDGLLLSQACEPHNCGDHKWTILIELATGATDVCYHDAVEIAAGESRWYLASGATEIRPGLCPTE